MGEQMGAEAERGTKAPPRTTEADVDARLRAVAERIGVLSTRGDWDGMAGFLGDHWMEAWCALRPDELARLLSDAPASVFTAGRGGRVLHRALTLFLPGVPFAAVDEESAGTADEELGELDAIAVETVSLMRMRESGLAQLAGAGFERLGGRLARYENGLVDPLGDFGGMLRLQAGLAQLARGDFVAADAWFARAAERTPERLFFAQRDALANRALLHAAIGTRRTAEEILERIPSIPRASASWTEDSIDASCDVARLLLRLRRGDATALPRDVLSLPWRAIGTAWPLLLWVLAETELQRRRTEPLLSMVASVEQMRLPGVDGDGMAGSVIGLCRSIAQRASGRPVHASAVAPEWLETDVPLARVIRARLRLAEGDAAGALDIIRRIDERGGHIERVTGAANLTAIAAHLQLEDEASARAVAARLSRDDLAPGYLYLREPRTVALIASMPGFSDLVPVATGGGAAALADIGETLTTREREVFGMLMGDISVDEICRRLYVTRNTVKTHRRNLYRKLGVRSREQLRAIGLANPHLWR